MKVLALSLSVVLGTPLLALLSENPEVEMSPVTLSRTDPKTWSKNGWRYLKWGMGSADVKAALKLEKLNAVESSDEHYVYTANLPEQIFRVDIEAAFGFSRDRKRLEWVALFPAPKVVVSNSYDCDARCMVELEVKQFVEWNTEVFDALITKYGEPDCPYGSTKGGCTFRSRSLGLHISYVYNPMTPRLGRIRYTDLAVIEREEAQKRQQEMDKL